MNNTVRRPKITVSADGTGLVSQAGTLLLAEAARVTGLGEGLAGGLAPWRAPRAVHDPGKVAADLALTIALGGAPRPAIHLDGPRLASLRLPAGFPFSLASEHNGVLYSGMPSLDSEEIRARNIRTGS